MGQYASKCCKKATLEESEKVPLVDLEKGGKAADKNAAEGDVSGPPIEPDPAVFYAKSTPHLTAKSSSSRGGGKRERGRGRHDNNDTARETGSSTSTKRNKHHHRSKKKVGEETILRFHKDHPTKAPLLGSSSEEDEDVDGTGAKASKNWIGVCNARLQHRVWWYSVTFVLCFIVGVGCYFGFTLSFDSTKGSGVSPLYPRRDVVDPEPDPHTSGGRKSSSSSSSASASSPPRPPAEKKGPGVDEESGAGGALGDGGEGGRGRRESGSRGYDEGAPASRWTSAAGNHDRDLDHDLDHDLDLDHSSSNHPSSHLSSKSSPKKKPPLTKTSTSSTSTSMNEYDDVVDHYDGGGDGVEQRGGRGEEGVSGAEEGRANPDVPQGGGALRSRKMAPGGGGGGRGASVVRSDVAGVDSRRRKSGVGDSGGGRGGGLPLTEDIEEDPDVKDAVKDAVSRLLRKQIADIAKERTGEDPTTPASSGDSSSSPSP